MTLSDNILDPTAMSAPSFPNHVDSLHFTMRILSDIIAFKMTCELARIYKNC